MAKDNKTVKVINKGGLTGALFAAWIGALVYFVQASEGFGGFLLAILKSFFWPAFLVHRAFELLSI